jgi:folate-binding protein YgfZ
MSFKLNLTAVSGFQLPSHAVVHVQGEDSGAFLQAQLMNDVTALAVGRWQYTGWLNAQGRVLALFQLAKLSPEHFLIILPALSPEWLIDSLKRYVFRAKVRFSLEQEFTAQGELLTGDLGIGNEHSITGDAQTGYCLPLSGPQGSRRLHLLPAPAALDAQAADQWHCLDMLGGWVWITEGLQGTWTPQMLSLQRLSAFSLKKGCYPGQEIVARTHYLGKSKRQLVELEGLGLVDGQSLQVNGVDGGKVVNANQSGTFGVAVLAADLDPTDVLTNAFGQLALRLNT